MDVEWDAERRPAWERAVHSVNCARLLRTFMNCCVFASFPFGLGGGMWDLIVLILDHCFSIYFVAGNIRLLPY